jgi:hypothetical protein
MCFHTMQTWLPPGLAHLLEHMAFKGTPRIGSRDWRTEQPLLAAQDEVFYELRQLQSEAEASGRSASRSARMQQLQERLDALKVRCCSLRDVGRELLWVLNVLGCQVGVMLCAATAPRGVLAAAAAATASCTQDGLMQLAGQLGGWWGMCNRFCVQQLNTVKLCPSAK